MPPDRDLSFYAMMIPVLVFWGVAFTAIRVALQDMSWVTLTLLRFLVALLCFALVWPWVRGKPIERRDLPAVALLGFLGFTGYHAFLNYGEQSTTAGAAALVIASVPTFVAVFAVVFLKEKLTSRRVAGIALSFVGLAVMILVPSGASSLAAAFSLGTLAVVPSAVMAGLFTVLGKRLLATYDPFRLIAAALVFGTVFTLPLAAWEGGTAADIGNTGAVGWAAVLYLGVFPTFVAYGLWYKVLERREAARIGVWVYLSTLIAVTAGVVVLGEPITVPMVVGGAMVVGGVALAQ